MSNRQTKYAIFVLMTATKEWLALTREARNRFVETTLGPLFEKYSSKLSVRFFDAEAFSATCSDIAMFETTDLQQYYYFIEELRDTEIFTVPYFELNEVIPAIEGGFVQFEEEFR